VRISRREINYLLVIKRENDSGRGARISTIAKSLNVSPASAYEEVMHLVSKGLVNKVDEYVYITELGSRELINAIRAHRIMEVLLVRAGMELDDACRSCSEFDSMIPEEVVERIYEYLGKPGKCPHGNEIPK